MSALVLVIVGIVALVVGGVLATLFAALRDFSWSGLEETAKANGRGVVGPRIAKILDDPEGHARSILLPRVLCHMTVVVATVLLLERLAGAGTDAGSEALRWLAVAGGILGSGVLVWLFGTVIPMSIAAHAAEGTLYRWAGLVRGVHVLTSPAGSLSAGIDEIVRRVVGKERLDAAAEVESEILEAVEEGEREGQINEDEREMIEAVVEFRSLTVEQIMTPRTEVTAIEYSDDVAGVGRALETAGHSRVPVYSGSLDHIDGMLYAKDFLHYLLSDEAKREGNSGFALRNHLRPAVFVPETKTVRELLSEMLSARVHAAMVTDEYGGTSGMVTLEDIVEEIFGEIEDEFEEVEEAGAPSVDLDPESMTARVDARLRIDDANDRLESIGLHLPESEDYDTVGGLVVVSLGRIPTEGETLRVNGVVLTVLAAEPTRVTRVRVEKAEASEPSEAVQAWDAGGK